MPRFAILTHDHPFLHWDFLLEQGSTCRTWRLLQRPDAASQIPAEPLPDHRILYLDYEGPISGDRGNVTRWDGGTFDLLSDQPEKVVVMLHGHQVTGEVTMLQNDDGSWQWHRKPM
ncbi:MAG: hypothetical protein JWP89_5112 [Schlesneria sp.]|nr:hypothetical protein [Schlesneria sp.]